MSECSSTSNNPLGLFGKLIVMLGGLMVLSGCGSSRPSSPPDNLACNLSRYQVRDIYDSVYVAKAKAPTAEVNILQLSAGGEFGAYGAGYLNAWGKLGSNAKPIARKDIQIVTGVSSGALMATHAFLASFNNDREWDNEIEIFYRNLNDAQIYSKRNYLSLLWANSLLDTTGKQRLLQNHINSTVINLVKNAPEDRSLFIGFTNLDTGEFIRIDMKQLANGQFESQKQRDDCYRAVIDASTAIEVEFPPVFIDGHMMGDGGARQFLFLVSPNLVPSSDVRDLRLRTFALIHGDLEVTPLRNGVRNGVLDIAERTASVFADQTIKSSVRLSNALAVDPAVIVGKENAKKLPRLEPFYGAAAHAACDCSASIVSQCDPADLFCRAFMNCLADEGGKEGAAAASSGKWLKIEDLPLGSKPWCPLPSGPNFR